MRVVTLMCRLPRLLARRIGQGERSSARGSDAPAELRRRVLLGVRGEEQRAPGPDPSRPTPGALVKATRAAAAGAAVIFLGILAAHELSGDSHPTRAPTSSLQASLHPVGTRADLVVSGMPEPPIGEVYEVWVERTGHPPRPRRPTRCSPSPATAARRSTCPGDSGV
ncbi:MAG TPA: anti-sigma factor [Solirubrobacteraceae bacterium]